MDSKIIDINKLKESLGQKPDIPTLPIMLIKAMKKINDAEASTRDLEKLISKDQAISAKILRLVNSAYYGLSEKITSIQRAITILGFDAVRDLLLGITVIDKFRLKYYDLKPFWLHSIAVATGACYLATKARSDRPQEAFSLGLLHDIGKLVIITNTFSSYRKIRYKIEEDRMSSVEAENDILGINHCQVGRLAIEMWGLPRSFASTIFYHHWPHLNKIDPLLTYSVYLADVAANVVFDDREDLKPTHLSKSSFFTETGFEDIKSYLQGRSEEISEFLGIIN